MLTVSQTKRMLNVPCDKALNFYATDSWQLSLKLKPSSNNQSKGYQEKRFRSNTDSRSVYSSLAQRSPEWWFMMIDKLSWQHIYHLNTDLLQTGKYERQQHSPVLMCQLSLHTVPECKSWVLLLFASLPTLNSTVGKRGDEQPWKQCSALGLRALWKPQDSQHVRVHSLTSLEFLGKGHIIWRWIPTNDQRLGWGGKETEHSQIKQRSDKKIGNAGSQWLKASRSAMKT